MHIASSDFVQRLHHHILEVSFEYLFLILNTSFDEFPLFSAQVLANL